MLSFSFQGFYHEQSRPDRDDYVSVQWANIVSGKRDDPDRKITLLNIHRLKLGAENNFNKYSDADIDTLKTSYDYGSVMHYGDTDFTSNGLRTIIPTQDPSAEIGQRRGMSDIDILEVQRYYGCVAIP